ncbi:NADP-dependent oxidoreductase [Kitasatospora purpeofusca]|uniref:NADP-dependent oxidoreductase n=1 Tax=Kitasatospora purpeofusca TaxID=67352 RepID=UPI000A40693F|nr:NADP-dependent oxidoreductase [Kitasatospora purpeofusca]MCX4685166.1 NADP-dependent oxidoreductase [Kitasatospora purpeofusca]MCX4752341.1 NADP-dependent oxidoreductase [Kitasatospora purpeofusca]WSR31919.1 NADP-dependent oxidoreductase [Kitasatospora purpeofusca]WSR39946.1 NADP-dependent oxidoreductase [Kitasatospora purpeofusca]WTA54294.1 NADP-dependent oxidoreductase [Kitasatospora purpeofusca]
MKAIAIHRYGGPEEVEYTDLPDPKVGPDSVLVQVRAAGVNPVDWKVRDGLLDGLLDAHFPLVMGWDAAGVVRAVGGGVTEFAPGDEVYGYVRKDTVEHGTYAELVAAPVRTLARKPAALDWAQAGGLPLAGLTALQSLRAVGVGPGDTVLVHAAAGGVGHLAVQIARALGARVIGTAGERNHDYLRELGAEPVRYGEGLAERVRALAPEGVDAALDLVGGDAVEVSAGLVADPARIASVADFGVKARGGRYVWVRPDAAGLAELAALADEGRLTVTVASTFPLAQAASAQALSAEGRTRGKIVLLTG